jgi:hypothetical protein
MRLTRLLPLAGLLAILIVAAMLLKRPSRPTSLSEEVGFERLVPSTLQVDAIQGLDLYQGSAPEKVLQLRRENKAWVASSHYNAPVQSAKLQGLLTTLGTLSGELRSEKADLLQTFKLNDAEALHLRLYTTELTTPAVHLLAGKTSGRTGFMRRDNDPRVYSVNMNVYQAAGLHGDQTTQPPAAKPWLDLQMLTLVQDHLSAVELHTPARRLQLVRQPSPSPDETTSQPPTDTPPPSPTWELVLPNLGYEVKQGYVKGLLNTLATLRGDDIADPAQVATYGFDTPAYRAVMTLQAPGEEVKLVSLLVGKEVPEQSGKRYARIGDTGHIYVLPSWSLNQVFPTLGRVLTIPLLTLHPQDVQAISWQHDGTSATLRRQPSTPAAASQEERWHFGTNGETAVDTQQVTSLLNTLRDLTAEDWLETPPPGVDLARPPLSLTLTQHNGTTLRLTVSAAHDTDRLHYARLHNTSAIFALSDTTYTSLTAALVRLQPKTPAGSTPQETVTR